MRIPNQNLLVAAAILLMLAAQAQALTLNAADFGLHADGKTDDGPAIQRALTEARAAKGPVVLRFPKDKTIYVKTAPSRYVFPLEGVSDLHILGRGCTFILDPHLRFMSLTQSRNVFVGDLNIDFHPLPFVEGLVTAVNKEERFIDVQLRPGQGKAPSGGPTREDGEQAFFSMLWFPGAYGLVSQHYWTANIERTSDDNTIRVYSTEEFTGFDRIQPGTTQVSVPVPGIAHRYGPGPCFRVHDNEDVIFFDIELWSAPWFGFNVMRNSGSLLFNRVNIRPKPDSQRLMSLWRDGFHVKGNRASMCWEACIVKGMNDDAFNISTHSCVIRRVISPDCIVVNQKFPLGYIPWTEGATLAAAHWESGQLLPSNRVTQVEESPPRLINGKPAAPEEVTLHLSKPEPQLQPGIMVWDPESANPGAFIYKCTIGMSCRLQSSVHLQNCDITGLLWFYSEHVEGPFPAGARVENCTLRRGRGNPRKVLVFDGIPDPSTTNTDPSPLPRAIHDLFVHNNRIYGDFHLVGTQKASITDNQFLEKGAEVVMRHNHELFMEKNQGMWLRPSEKK